MKIEEQVRRACPYKATMLIIAPRRPYKRRRIYTHLSDSTLIESILVVAATSDSAVARLSGSSGITPRRCR